MPFSLVDGAGRALEWLNSLERNVALLREMRPRLNPEVDEHLKVATRAARLALRAIDAEMADAAARQALRALQASWLAELSIAVLPRLRRDKARTWEGPRKPDLEQWIDEQLQKNPSAKSPELWKILPRRFKDDIGAERFAKRVTVRRRSGRKA